MKLLELISWYGWRRWRIDCPKGDVSHLFERSDFQNELFNYDEAFISPCSFHPVNSGGICGKWQPKITFISFELEGRE